MDQRVKEMWLKALRGGEFRQCRSQLSHSGGYCCLGVLEHLAFREGVIQKFDGDRPYLSPAVKKWAELDDGNPVLGVRANSANAAALNDRGESFNYIADRIEKYL